MTSSERVLSRWLKQAFDPRRPRWIPADAPEIKPEGTDLVMYPYERGSADGVIGYGLVAFMGKQNGPFHNYTYGKRRSDRDKTMQGLVDNRRAELQRKLDERVKKKEFKTGLFYGDILYTSWGYDQTNVDFYEVVEVVGGQTVTVREVAQKVVGESDGLSERVAAVPGKYVGPELKVRVQAGDRAKIKGHYASRWDGHPVYQTGPYGGH